MSTFESVALAATIVLALGGLAIALWATVQIASMRDQLDRLDDLATPSIREDLADPPETEEREYLRADGTTARFQIRSGA